MIVKLKCSKKTVRTRGRKKTKNRIRKEKKHEFAKSINNQAIATSKLVNFRETITEQKKVNSVRGGSVGNGESQFFVCEPPRRLRKLTKPDFSAQYLNIISIYIINRTLK